MSISNSCQSRIHFIFFIYFFHFHYSDYPSVFPLENIPSSLTSAYIDVSSLSVREYGPAQTYAYSVQPIRNDSLIYLSSTILSVQMNHQRWHTVKLSFSEQRYWAVRWTLLTNHCHRYFLTILQRTGDIQPTKQLYLVPQPMFARQDWINVFKPFIDKMKSGLKYPKAENSACLLSNWKVTTTDL